ncbi:MAG TPA: M48 family metallopeptidase [Bacteroidia bacterium]|nr:M48 family metallopeptidase [Bacteroidia bacterium]
MKKILLFITAFTVFSCSKVPITGRKQMNLLPESTMMSMSLSNYRDFLSQHPPVTSGAEMQQVKNIGAKISSAVEQYMRQNKMADRVKGYKWEFNLVNDKAVNAWCMPGGKVVVYTGLLPITQDETHLAFVMGHEVAHAVARHGNERMSQMLLAATGGIALDVALSQKPSETRAMFLGAYGVATTVGVILPFSRTHESEADKLGMVFMAMAGYNPTNALDMWERMSKAGGGKMPEFLSTHPSDATRSKNMRAYLPQAMKYYHPN